MHDEENPKWLLGKPVDQEIPSQASPLVMQRREMTAGFDERQRQLFNEALIAILTIDMPAEKITEVLTKAYDSTIQVFGWQMLADTSISNAEHGSEGRLFEQSPPSPPATERLAAPDNARPVLLSCTNCHGYRLTLRGRVVQCDDCGAIQPTLDDASPDRASRERAYAKMLDREGIPKKQIVNVTVSGSTLALMFHDGTVQRQTIPDPAVCAISYLLRVLDTMTWAREELENRLLKLRRERGNR